MTDYVNSHIFSSEAVSEGHPDKLCDKISDAVLDACLAADPDARVACETAAATDLVVNLGEISGSGVENIDTEKIARDVVKEIGYDRPKEGFSWNTFKYLSHIHSQSPDIAMGISRGDDVSQGAGDQGMMFGYATNATPEYMPAPIMLSHRLVSEFSRLRHKGEIPYLRPDSKAQVSVVFMDGRPVRLKSVVVSHQTEPVDIAVVRRDIEERARDILSDTGLVGNETRFLINPTGRFEIGGPAGDAGLTGRKIIVDTYGGSCSHGGGAFSGKDPSKVDRSAAYYARYAAKNIVAAGIAERCRIQVAYAIGIARPLSLSVSFFGTGTVSEERMSDFLLSGELFDFRPGCIVAELGLKKPSGWSYSETTNGGHFGRDVFPWERLDKVDALRNAF